MNARTTTRLLSALAASAALVLLALWWLDDDTARTPVADMHAAVVAEAQPAPTVPALDDAREPESLAPAPLAAPTDAPPPPQPTGPLSLSVRHAHGPPAAGAVVAMYARDVDERFLLEAELDAEGRWEHPGLDAPVTLFVVGASLEPARLELDVARGAHDVVLPDGAWLAGVVLIEGAPPGHPFPLRLQGIDGGEWVALGLPRGGVELRGFQLNAPSHPARGSLRTDAAGRFLVSGLSPHDELQLTPPGSFDRDEARSTPEPVHAPFDGYVLALTRRPMIRGRLLHADGRPAAHVEFDLTQVVQRRPPPGNDAQPHGTSALFRGGRTDAEGRFAVGVHRYVDLNCYALVDGRLQRSEGCPPPSLRVDFRARHATAGIAEFHRDDFDPYQGADLGDVFLEPSPAWHLRVLDPDGAPIPDARIERVKHDPETGRLDPEFVGGVEVDADGRATVFERDCDARLAIVLAPGHRALRVDFDEHVGEDPIEVVLPPSSGVLLRILTADGRAPSGAQLEVRGAPPVFTDTTAKLPVDKLQRLQPHVWRNEHSHLGWARASMDGEDVVVRFQLGGPLARVDALVPGKPLTLRIYLSERAARGNTPAAPEHTLWEQELRLGFGEQRVIEVDLLEPASDG